MAGATSSANLGQALHPVAGPAGRRGEQQVAKVPHAPAVPTMSRRTRQRERKRGSLSTRLSRCCVIPELTVGGGKLLHCTVIEKGSACCYVPPPEQWLEPRLCVAVDQHPLARSLQPGFHSVSNRGQTSPTSTHRCPRLYEETAIVAHLPAVFFLQRARSSPSSLVKGWEGALMAQPVWSCRKEMFSLGRLDIARPAATTTRPCYSACRRGEARALSLTVNPDAGRALAPAVAAEFPPSAARTGTHTKNSQLPAIAQTCELI